MHQTYTTMPIYAVSVQHTIYVKADHETKACHEAERHVKNEMADSSWAEEMHSIEDVPYPWQDAIPYGENEDRTVADLLT